MQYYLRVEGVNLAHFVYDTQDLSTVRGGSLLLLRAVEEIRHQVQIASLEPISTGASIGLFRYDAPDEAGAQQVRREVEEFLHKDNRFKHATFVVDIQPDKTNYVQDREAVWARNRWRQMQQPTVAVPQWNTQHYVTACAIDGIRPAVSARHGSESLEHVSTSVQMRSTWGRKQKQQFYKDETRSAIDIDKEFVHDFDELTAKQDHGHLHHKMAVIYVDGNSFGALRDATCKTPEAEGQFAETLKEYRRTALKELLALMQHDTTWVSTCDRYRLETLLWGGDELLWVVPAWHGWRVLQQFYAQSEAWKFAGKQLKHAAGLVFCHHKAPIHRITALAKELAELAKDTDRETNLVAYQVLESFDHIGRDLKPFLDKRYGDAESIVVQAEKLQAIEQAMRPLKAGFPRSKLYSIVHKWEKTPEEAERLLQDTTKHLDTQTIAAWEQLKECFRHHTPALCCNTAELWDYVAI